MSILNQVKSTYSFWGHHPALYGGMTWLTFLGQERKLRSKVAEALRLKPGGTVLDIACGSGRNFPSLQKAVGETGRLIGFDYSAEMLEAAGRLVDAHQWQNVRLLLGDAAELDISDGNIDAAVSTLGISAVPDYRKAIGRVRDVLKTGGIFAVCDAKPFEGPFAILNPLIRPLYGKTAAWNPNQNIPQAMRDVFGNVRIEKHLGGAFYIAVSEKSPL